MKKHLIKAETTLTLLIVMLIFTTLFFSYTQWQSRQTTQTQFLYQQQQALQIAENQIALKMADEPCQRSVLQNNLQFTIYCQNQEIKVVFPVGEIKIGKP